MSLCQTTGSRGPCRCKARAEDRFQKALFTYQPPKIDIYVPTPIGTFSFMSGSPFSFSDDDTLCLPLTLSSSVLLIFTSWVWRLICFESYNFTLALNVLSNELVDGPFLSFQFIFQFGHILKLRLH